MINGWHLLALVFLALVFIWARREQRIYEQHRSGARERLAESARRAQAEQPLASVTPLWPRAVRDEPRDAA